MNIRALLHNIKTIPKSAIYFEPPFFKGAKTVYFPKPEFVIDIHDRKEVDKTFMKIEALRNDKVILSLLNYEFYHFLIQSPYPLVTSSKKIPLASFFVYSPFNIISLPSSKIDFTDVPSFLKKNSKTIDNFTLNTEKQEYLKNIEILKNEIGNGNSYQINYTVKGKFDFSGDIDTLFMQLMYNQSSRYNFFINTGNNYIISFSPELFFNIDGKSIITKPMKGTINRGRNIIEDLLKKDIILSSTKEQSENVMIVDLLRNDLGQISQAGSVKVKKLLDLEKYETVFQMTSTIKSILKSQDIGTILSNIFPSGSITGAPKIKTMELIEQIEKEKRGIYTGAIGIIEKDKANFNVAIRTLKISRRTKKGEVGLGSGITWRSNPDSEYEEVKLKGEFLTKPLPYFELFETILVENSEAFLLDLHLERLQNAASFFLFCLDSRSLKKSILSSIAKIESNDFHTNHFSRTFRNENTYKKYKLKILLNKWGKVTVIPSEISSIPLIPAVIVSPARINSSNRFQYFKTTNRTLYDKEYSKYSKSGFTEVIFLNEKGELTEGSFTNIIIRKNNIFYTPPVESGILNGVYRQHLMLQKKLIEKPIKLSELLKSDEVILINSIRKEIRINPEKISTV